MSKLLRISLFLMSIELALPVFAAPCALNPTSPSVTICTPANGANVSSPVNIVAGTTDSSPVTAMGIYVDNVLATKQSVSEINVNIDMSAGNHYVVVQAWDQAGRIFKTPINIGVTDGYPIPLASLTASASNIQPGNSVTISWQTSYATNDTIDNGIGAVSNIGSVTVSPASTTTYTLTASGPGGTKTVSVTVNVGSSYPPPIVSLTADKTSIQAGDSATLSWGTAYATDDTIDHGIGAVSNMGSTLVSPSSTTTYTLTGSGPGGTRSASVTISVGSSYPPPIVSLTADKTSIQAGDSATLSWGTAYATDDTIDHGIGAVSNMGSTLVSPSSTTTYTLTGSGPGGARSASVTITVGSGSPNPIASISVSPTNIQPGQSATLSWETTYATDDTIDQGIGAVSNIGSITVSPASTTTYRLTAAGPGGTKIVSTTLTVGAGGGTCTPGSANPSITICQPQNGSIVASPVRIVAATTDSHTVTAMAIYIDNSLVYKEDVSSVDTSVNLTDGSHYIVVQNWDNTGAVTKASVNITVSVAAVPTISFVSNPGLISSGQSSTLTWSTTGATSVLIDNGIGAVPLSGSQTVSPTATTTYTLTASGSAGSATASTTVSVSGSTGDGGITKINHIIFALQENRSFDSYFGMINKYRASLGLPQDVDAFTLNSSGVPVNSNPDYSRTGSVTVFHMQSMCTENLSPSWDESHVSANFGNSPSNTFLNDGFVWVAGHNARDTDGLDVNGLRAMGYYDYNDLPYYYFIASQFAMSDRWFSPAPANTNTNRHFMYAATSNGHAYPWTGAASTSPTIWDRLTAAGISWKVYVADFNSTVFYEFINSSRYGDHIFPIKKYFDDIAAGALPQVVTLETAGLNEHPENNIQAGAAFMASAVNALMGSQYWKDSAFILTYDEFGGLYDHVHPQLVGSPDGVTPIDLKNGDTPGDFTRTGFRVPFMVISPFARPHYVSHTVADHTAILKFIEKRFALQPLTSRDAAQMDMTEFFDFNNPTWATPPTPPAQPQNAPCYYDHLP